IMAETAEEITKKVAEKEKEFKSIFDRMDFDYGLWSKPGKVTNINDSIAFKGARTNEIKYISPHPRSLADHIHSRVANSTRAIIIRMLEKEGEDKRDDISKLERLQGFGLEMADDRLTDNPAIGIPLLDYLIWSAMMRGRLAGRFLVWGEDGKTIFDYVPLDPRFLILQAGSKGMSWTAYKTYRSAEEIKDDYGIEPKSKGILFWKTKEQNNVVIDYWKTVKPGVYHNTVILDKDQVLLEGEWELSTFPIHYLAIPSVPPISTGQPPSGKGELKQTSQHGDSIYAGVREICQFGNDMVSMWASHAKLLAEQPIVNYFDEEGKSDLTTTTSKAGLVINLPMGHNKLEPTPVKEVSPTLVNLVQYVDALRQVATLPDAETGGLRTPPYPSGTALEGLKEARQKVFGPLIRSLNIFYTNISRSVEQQLIKGSLSVTVKSELNRKYYEHKITSVDLKRPHTVRVEFTAQTPWEQMDTIQRADMLKRQGLPDQWIWEHVYKIQDPKGLEDLSAVEIAEHSPTLIRLKAIGTLLKQGRKDEANVLIQELYTEWLQQQQEQGQLTAGGVAPEEEVTPPVAGGTPV
ncbi:hypothetical protein KAT51_02920, partial [bacterium]|nr:hypothetical protein [bacterium]